MASAPIEDDTTGQNECSLCLNKFREDDIRTQIPCGHSFCMVCSIHVCDILSETLTCPVCPPRDILLEVALIQSLGDPGVCSWCSKQPVSSYCFQCCRPMCSTCKIVHKQNEQFSSHVTTLISVSAIHHLMCADHGVLCSSFCYDCRSVVCQECLSVHGMHGVVNFSSCGPTKGHLDEEILVARSDFSELLSEMGVQLELLLQEIYRIETEQTNDLQHDVNKLKPYLQILVQQNKTKHNLFQPFPQLRHLSLKTAYKILDTFKEELFVTHFPELDPGRSFFIPRKLEHLLSDLERVPQPDPIGRENVQTKLFDFIAPRLGLSVRYYDVDIMTSSTGDVEIKDNTAIAFFTTKEQQRTEQRAELLWTKSTRLSVFSIVSQPSGDVILVEGGFFVFHMVKTYNLANGDYREEHALLEEKQLECMALDPSTGNIAASTPAGKSVIIYTQTDGTWTSQTHRVVDDSIRGVAYTRTSNLVVGSWKTLTCINPGDGEIIWTKKVEHVCHYIAVDSINRIIISDNNSNKIHIYDIMGNLMETFPDTADGPVLRDPRGLCVDTRNNILVVDRKKEAVLLFDSGGNYIRDIIKVPGRPKFIALHDDKYLYVATSTKTISLYRIRLFD